MVVHVQKRDGERHRRENWLIELLVLERNKQNQTQNDHLNEGQSRQGESGLHVLGFFRRLGGEHFGLLISRHFIMFIENNVGHRTDDTL